MATKEVRSMISEVSICNQALLWVGANTITSFEDPSTEAEWCRANYPFLRDAVLEARMWTFSIARKKSGPVADLSEWGNKFLHRVPAEWLLVTKVFSMERLDLEQIDDRGTWHREGEFILSDYDTVYMYGIQRVTDTGKFTNMFAQALAARMACEMAVPFAESRTLQADLWGLYEKKISEAAATDGRQGMTETIRPGGRSTGLLTGRRAQ
jgi:hypothetical protein